ncbi:hypothetical protein HY78_14540 [Rhizorhabdus wittichii DC-6]|nr:hypothetical protein HY78_14540 [Rhizorhabdus wittichii DC-6]
MSKIYASLPILVNGKHHDLGDEIRTDRDDAAALLRLGRAHDEETEKARRAAVKPAPKPAA